MNTTSPLSSPVSPETVEKQSHQRMFNVPPVTLFLALILVAIHCLRAFYLSNEDDMMLVLRFGFTPLHLREYAFSSIWPWLSLVTYAGLHFGWTHLVVNVTGLLAFGAATERTFGWKKYLLILIAGTIAGALAHFIFFSDSSVLLGGISAGLSALFAVVLGLMQQRAGWRGLIIPSAIWMVMNVLVGFMGIPDRKSVV